jgi:hypothetical protein
MTTLPSYVNPNDDIIPPGGCGYLELIGNDLKPISKKSHIENIEKNKKNRLSSCEDNNNSICLNNSIETLDDNTAIKQESSLEHLENPLNLDPRYLTVSVQNEVVKLPDINPNFNCCYDINPPPNCCSEIKEFCEREIINLIEDLLNDSLNEDSNTDNINHDILINNVEQELILKRLKNRCSIVNKQKSTLKCLANFIDFFNMIFPLPDC